VASASDVPIGSYRFNLREATVRDVATLAELHVETFAETHGGGPPVSLRETQWQRILGANDAADFTFVVEASSGELVGFARGTRHDGGVPGYQGELNKIYVLRGHQRHGLGRLLVCQIAKRFLDQGITSMLLFGDASSPSNGFYEHMGAVRLLSPEAEFHGAYGWPGLDRLIARCGGELNSNAKP
jgi:GNAT superfamily N-acetyltransferase